MPGERGAYGILSVDGPGLLPPSTVPSQNSSCVWLRVSGSALHFPHHRKQVAVPRASRTPPVKVLGVPVTGLGCPLPACPGSPCLPEGVLQPSPASPAAPSQRCLLGLLVSPSAGCGPCGVPSFLPGCRSTLSLKTRL